ncbi:lipopolysaccharide biosynthesis protein [Flavobacteriaceae bacterium LMO-SS05]
MNEGIKGFGWNSIAQGYKVLFSSVVLVILARLISVEEFGIIGMSTVFVLFFNTLLNIGFDSSIIYSKTLKDKHLFSLFLLNVTIGVFIYFIGYLSAPLISEFYKNNQITIIFRALIFGALFSSLGIVSKGVLQKNLEFKKIALIDLIGITLAGLVAITMALRDYGYWALILQQLLTVGLTSLGYLVISYNKVFKSITIRFDIIKEHFKFGYNVFIFNVVNFFAQQLDVLLIGRLLGEAETGLYILAFNLVLKPIGLLVQVFNKTLYPILAQFDKESIAEKYSEYTLLFFFVFSPLIIFCISLSQILAPYILTSKWHAILLLLIVFGYQSIRTILASPSGLLFLLTGNPKKQWRFSLFISIPLRILGMFLGYIIFKSALGIVIGINIFATAEMIAGFYITFKLVDLKIVDYLKVFKEEFISLILLSGGFIIINIFIDYEWISLLAQCICFLGFILFKKEKLNYLLFRMKVII